MLHFLMLRYYTLNVALFHIALAAIAQIVLASTSNSAFFAWHHYITLKFYYLINNCMIVAHFHAIFSLSNYATL